MAENVKIGRNERCPCGSGKKFKQCCGGPGVSAKMATGAGATTSPAAVVQRARQLVAAGRYEEAIPALTEAIRVSPRDGELVHDLGMACLLTRRLEDAVGCLQRSVAMQPKVGRAHFSLGLALQQTGRDEPALASYLRAVALSPELAEAHRQIADLLIRNGRRTEAALAYERAAEAAPGTTFGLLCKAKALTVKGRAAEAEEPLRQLLLGDASSGEAHLMLGNILSEAGRFDEAAEQFERSLALAPWQATAHHALVSLRRVKEADRPLVTRIEARLKAPDVAPRQRMTLHFAAGKAFDDLRDYAAAIAHFDAANALRRELSPLDRGALSGLVDRLIARFTPDFFAQHAAMGCADERPVLVLGMPRSGTTLTERIVSSHPEAAGGGELLFWNEHAPALVGADVDSLGRVASSTQSLYGELLSGIGPEALRVTDKMPGNFLWLGLVHLLFPNARFVHCRRNPVDTCLSLYSTDITGSWGFASDRGDLVWYYRQYLRVMEHWRAVIPQGRLLDVDYEVATGAPEDTARRLIAFVGLPWDPLCLEPDRNPDAIKTANKWQARQPIYRTSVERWRNYEPWLGDLRQLLPGEG